METKRICDHFNELSSIFEEFFNDRKSTIESQNNGNNATELNIGNKARNISLKLNRIKIQLVVKYCPSID